MEFASALPDEVDVAEVGPREGFQAESNTVATKDKVALIDALARTGLRSIQATSFVHPKIVPQHADAEEVMRAIQRPSGLRFGAVVPNLRGAERAAAARVDVWGLMLSASESHSRANSNSSTEKALARLEPMVALARDVGAAVHGGMSTALGCPFEGRIPLSRLRYIVDAYVDLGVPRVSIADTAGMADPRHVYETCAALLAEYPQVEFTLHLHDTRGMGLANVLAGLQAGVRVFDSSIGGVGGCPFVPEASGNIATEDLVHMLEHMGIKTNINLGALITVARGLADLLGHPIRSAVARAGTSDELHDLAVAKIAAV